MAMIPSHLLKLARQFPGLSHYVRRYEDLRHHCADQAKTLAKYERSLFPPGHYYSPVPDFDVLERDAFDAYKTFYPNFRM